MQGDGSPAARYCMDMDVLSPVRGTLAERITAAPCLQAPADARAKLEAWLAEISGTPAAAALKRALADHPNLFALIAGLAEGSPHLWELVRAEPDRLVALLESDPDRRLDAIIADATRAIAQAEGENEVMRYLRRMKSEGALLIGLADIGGVWPVMRVTAALTALADAAVAGAVHHLLLHAVRRGRYQPVDPAQPERGSGYIVLAMGKMGAGELNYSSDIDLIVFYDAGAAALAEGIEPSTFFVRLTRRLVKLLQERTADGYVFRTDLRLRPDPASTPIAVSTAAALDYYESVGQNWERAALIKARAVRRRRRGRRGASQGACRRSSGASISISPRSPTFTR